MVIFSIVLFFSLNIFDNSPLTFDDIADEKPNFSASFKIIFSSPQTNSKWLTFLPVLILFIVCIILYFPNNIVLWLVLWQIASFIFNSFTAVLNYNRDYGKALIFEVISFFTLISLLIFSKNNMSLTLLIKYYTIQYIVKALLFSVLYIRFFKFNEFKFNTLLLRIIPNNLFCV